jgi:hypothetical protein
MQRVVAVILATMAIAAAPATKPAVDFDGVEAIVRAMPPEVREGYLGEAPTQLQQKRAWEWVKANVIGKTFASPAVVNDVGAEGKHPVVKVNATATFAGLRYDQAIVVYLPAADESKAAALRKGQRVVTGGKIDRFSVSRTRKTADVSIELSDGHVDVKPATQPAR